jgi:hypothetical protein
MNCVVDTKQTEGTGIERAASGLVQETDKCNECPHLICKSQTITEGTLNTVTNTRQHH